MISARAQTIANHTRKEQTMSNKPIGVFVQDGQITIVKEKTVVVIDKDGKAHEMPNIMHWLKEDDEG